MADERLTPYHISLYVTLFDYWNTNHFRNPLTLYREETMAAAKIGSINTYLKCLKNLSEWNYIQYQPSFNPQQGSKVHLLRFDKGADKGDGKADVKRSKGSSKGTDKGGETYNINIPNNTNDINNLNIKNAYEPERKISIFTNNRTSDTNSEASHPHHKKRQEEGRRGRAIPATGQEVQDYFIQSQSTAIEAEKFFNHYQSNGWRVGGRTPMKDWQASARNWIINSKKFNHEHTTLRPGSLQAPTDVDYSEPL